ncbi:unnamed protein product, partial [Effrenium voratum]
EAAAFLPTLQLLTLLLAERLTSLHWEAEAHRSEAVINRLLQGVDVLAKPSEEWEKNLMQRAAEVPKEVLRGDVTLQEAAVWQPNQRSYVNVCGQSEGNPSRLVEEAFSLPNDTVQVICTEESVGDPTSTCSSLREICIVLPGIGKPTVLDFLDPVCTRKAAADCPSSRLNHFDLAAAEWLCKSSLRAALQARSKLHELILHKHSSERMQSLVSELSMAANTADLVQTIEQAVQAVTQSDKCMVFFFENDSDEVWSPPTKSVPEPYRMVLDIGLPGKIAKLMQEKPAEFQSTLVYNDMKSCPHWDGMPFGMEDSCGILVAPIKSAGQDARPLGLILAGDKVKNFNEGMLLSALSFWGHVNADFSEQDAEFLAWLASAAGSHVERLSLDIMWTKALLERDEGEGEGMLKDDKELVSEYYTVEAVDARSRPRAGTTSSQEPRTQNRVTTVHKFLGHVPTAMDFGTRNTLAFISTDDRESIRSLTAASYADVTQWGIDYWGLTPHDEFTLLVTALRQLDIFDHIAIERGVLFGFFQAIKKNYRAVPFHNFQHALSTVHFASKMAKVANVAEHLCHAELYALIIGALCHDCDHRGYNNAFEIMTRSELALRYNDASPLENHHCARAFEIALSKEGCNIFQDFSTEVYSLIRKRMIAGILSTDMKHHGSHVSILKEFELGEASDSQNQFLVEVVMHAADISNPLMPADQSQKWCACLNEEFTLQVEKEAEMGLPVTTFMSGLQEPQVAAKSLLGFIDFVIIPFTSSVFRIFPDLGELKPFLDQNRETAALIVDEASTGKKRQVAKKTWQGALTRLRDSAPATPAVPATPNTAV